MEVNENEVNRVWLKSNSVIGQPLVNLNDRKDDAAVRSPSIPREKENELKLTLIHHILFESPFDDLPISGRSLHLRKAYCA